MNLDNIRTLYTYNYWANNKILEQAAKVSSEDLFKDRGYSWQSLAGTLVHTMDAEYGWRRLLEKGTSTELLTVDNFEDIPAIIARWQQEEADMWAYLDSLDDDAINRSFTYEVENGTRSRVLWHCLWHVVNHGTQHRSECAVILTELGHSPGEIDFALFTLTL